MFLQIAFVVVIILAGIAISFWARRANLQGFEIWLPMSILIGLAYGPAIGTLVASLIIIGAWVLFPYRLDTIFIMIVCIFAALFGLTFFTLTAANFVQYALITVVIFNVVSNVIFFFLGNNPATLVKFFSFSMIFSWLIFTRVGWQILEFLIGG